MDPYSTVDMPEPLRRYIRQVEERLRTRPPSVEYFAHYSDDTEKTDKWEKEQVERFVATGTCALDMSLDVDTVLQVRSKYVNDNGNILFTLDSDRITLHNTRSKHLILLLHKLADREGLELNFVDEYPQDLPNGVIRVAFWPLSEREEVDDTEIVLKAQPRLPEPDEPEPAYYGSAVWSRGVTITDDMPF